MPSRIPGHVPGRTLSLAALAATVFLAACGDGGGTSDETAVADEASRAIESAPESAAAALPWPERQARFLEDWAARSDVQASPGGVLYRVIEEGDGVSPAPGEIVRVHYEGRLIDDTVFDSSWARGEPAEFPSDRLIAGWREILGMMQEGDSWEIAIPSHLAYGPNGAGNVIPPDSALLFKLELLEVKG